jgi:nucleoside-diphosphate-sugar epimerase
MRENFQAVLDRAGHGGRVIALPEKPAILLLELARSLHLSPLYRWIYESAAHDSFVSVEKLKSALGFRARYSNEDALLRNYDWYVAHRHELGAVRGVTHRVPWKRGALRLAELFF